jgi:ADP-ribose pyrophosphatase YjhB (NUDIX family)
VSGREYPDRPWIGVGVVVFKGDAVLLVRRGKPPRMGEWSVPGGAQALGETAEATARRELREEARIEAGPLVLAAVVDALDPGPDGRPRFHYTIIDFAAEWLSGEPAAGDDVTDARWFAPADLPALNLWDEALRVIAEGRRRLDAAGALAQR